MSTEIESLTAELATLRTKFKVSFCRRGASSRLEFCLSVSRFLMPTPCVYRVPVQIVKLSCLGALGTWMTLHQDLGRNATCASNFFALTGKPTRGCFRDLSARVHCGCFLSRAGAAEGNRQIACSCYTSSDRAGYSGCRSASV